MAAIKVRINAKSENPTKTVVRAGKFQIIIDEPAALGGTNEGATPVDFLLAALSGCINVVGHIVAKEMGFDLRGMEIKIEGDLDPARLQGDLNAGRAGFSEIRASIIPDSDADEAILQDWLNRVEDRCPVSDNLANLTPVKVSLA